MKKLVVFGAGGIGRGFVGALFARAGYTVVFLDVDTTLVEALNARGSYPVRVLSDAGAREELVEGVRAVDASDAEAAAREIADASVMATAVGVRVLPHIAPTLARGLALRACAATSVPETLDVIVCENKLDAAETLGRLVAAAIEDASAGSSEGIDADADAGVETDADAATPVSVRARGRAVTTADILARVGFVETSIGRMVPVQTAAMRDGDPLRVCVEPYETLLVDRDGFKGAVPDVPHLSAQTDFAYYHKRKLFVHNLGHAAAAYLGLLAGYTYIWEAVADPEIRRVSEGAMRESARALTDEYGGIVRGTASRDEGYGELPDASAEALAAHIRDLLARFANRALGDTCARVAADPARKLAKGDRLVGAADYCASLGLPHPCIDQAIEAATARLEKERNEQR